MRAISVLILLYLLSALFSFISNKKNRKILFVWTSSTTIIYSIVLFSLFDFGKAELQFVERFALLDGINTELGIDKFAIFFVLFIAALEFLFSLWLIGKRNLENVERLFIYVPVACGFSVGAFCAMDLISLYFFIESSIIPLSFILLNSPDDDQRKSLWQYLTYSIISATLTMVAFVGIYVVAGTVELSAISSVLIQNGESGSCWMFWLLLIGVFMKVPTFPFHNWLPIVHVNTNVIGSIMFASIALKFSSLIFCRALFQIWSDVILNHLTLIFVLAIVSMLIAVARISIQKDIKKIFAYLSIIHMNLYLLGYICSNDLNLFLYSLLGHSLLMAFLFFITDAIETVYETRDLDKIQNSDIVYGDLKGWIFIGILISIGLPFTSSFLGELFSVMAIVNFSIIAAIASGVMLIILAVYMIYIYGTCFNKETVFTANKLFKIHLSKRFVLYALTLSLFALGILPKLILN